MDNEFIPSALFSPSTLTFYPKSMIEDGSYGDNLPVDLVEITENEQNTYWKQSPPSGQILGALTGRPAWVNTPAIIDSLSIRLSKLSTRYKADISGLNDSYLSALVNDGINETTKLQAVRDQISERKAQYIADIAAAKAANA